MPGETQIRYIARMSDMNQAVSLGVVGMGGFAEFITELVRKAGPISDPPVRLHAVCDPRTADFAQRATELEADGIAVFDNFEALLAEPIDAVWLPIPIPLHRPFTERALATGKAVMCEKPAAGVIEDVDAMIAARDRAGLSVAIGFQDIHDPATTTLKHRLLAGDLGRVRSASVVCCWPRGTGYFRRNDWAGRFKVGDTWVLDSPVNNAMAHYIALPLFLLGPTLDAPAMPRSISAELYRAAEIENYDTASLRVGLSDGVNLGIYYTHACPKMIGPVITIHTDRGRIVWSTETITIEINGETETLDRVRDAREAMVQRFARAVRGLPDAEVSLASLEVARAHTLVVNAASQAATVTPVPDHAIARINNDGGHYIQHIVGIEDALQQAADTQQSLHETGRLGFTVKPASLDLSDYRRFAGVPIATG